MRQSIGLQDFQEVDLVARGAANKQNNPQTNRNKMDAQQERRKRRRQLQEQQQVQQDDNLKVAPIISDHNLKIFKKRLFSTLTGFNIDHEQSEDKKRVGQQGQGQQKSCCTCLQIVNLLMYILMPVFIIIPPLVLTTNINSSFDDTSYNNSTQEQQDQEKRHKWVTQHILAVFIPVGLNLVFTAIYDILRRNCIDNKNRNDRSIPPVSFSRYLFILVYSYLWAQHISIIKYVYYNNLNVHDSAANNDDPTNKAVLESKNDIYSQYLALLVFAIISIVTSVSTIAIAPVREFSASSLEYSYPQFHHHASHSPHSTLYMRFIIAIPFLVLQTGLYYRENVEHYYAINTYLPQQAQTPEYIQSYQYNPLIQYINSILCFTFVLWTLGWLSSFYNMSAFLVNRVLNGLLFGECSHGQASNSVGLVGVNTGGKRSTWYMGFLICLGNFCLIAINYGVFRGFVKSGMFETEEISQQSGNIKQIKIQDQDEMFRIQHATLVILCSLFAVCYTWGLYCVYGCCNRSSQLRGKSGISYPEYQKNTKIMGQNNISNHQQQEEDHTFSHIHPSPHQQNQISPQQLQKIRQATPKSFMSTLFIVQTILELVFCIVIVLVIFFLNDFVSISSKQAYNQELPVDRDRSKIQTILGIHMALYILLVGIFGEFVRTRSKVGCQLITVASNSNNSDLPFQKIRDLVIFYILRISGTLSVIFIIQRLQQKQDQNGIDTFTKQLLGYNQSLQQKTSQNAYNFFRYFIIPVLILRTYKRLQYFNHSIHIALILSFIITLSDDLYYQIYPYILVVFLMPLFPDSPFKMLLMSPIIIPKKLVHKNQTCYRVFYYLINIMSGFAFVMTLGIFQFTMVFGLPIYWMAIPSTYCGGTGSHNSHNQHHNDEKSISNSQIHPQKNDNDDKNLQNTDEPVAGTPQYIIYKKFVQKSLTPYLPHLLKNKSPGYYLFRISKYIMLVEKYSGFYNLAESFRVIGLQAQEVTTCHAKQGESIDKCIQSTWPYNQIQRQEQQTCVFSQSMEKILHPMNKIPRVQITGENQIQLTGLIQSQAFYQLFKKVLMKSIIYLVDQQVKKRIKQKNNKARFWWEEHQRNIIETDFMDDLRFLCPKEKIQKIFPYSFVSNSKQAENSSKYFDIECEYPNSTVLTGIQKVSKPTLKNPLNIGEENSSKSSMTNGKKLPPISQNKAKKQGKGIDDFMDLLNNSSITQSPAKNQQEKNGKASGFGNTIKEEDNEESPPRSQNKKIQNSLNNKNEEQINQDLGMSEQDIRKRNKWYTTAVILTIYSKILGKTNYLNLEKLTKYLKKQEEIIQVNINANGKINKNKQLKNNMHRIVSQSIGHALKVSINKTLQGEENAELQDLLEYTKSQFLGVLGSEDFSQAVSNPKKNDIWTISYKSMQKKMTVKRLSIQKAILYVFQVDSMAVRAVWNNLRFQLLYAANDDDERYSIQTHAGILRNLLVQACEQPYGYAGFYSGEIVSI